MFTAKTTHGFKMWLHSVFVVVTKYFICIIPGFPGCLPAPVTMQNYFNQILLLKESV